MLPFTSVEFFFLSALLLGAAYLCKGFFSSLLSFRRLLVLLTFIYIAAYFNEPMKAFRFVLYSYVLYYVLGFILKTRRKLVGALLLALPLILVKASFHAAQLQFAGLSYVTFRAIQIYLDADISQIPVNGFDFFVFLLFPPTLLIGPIDRFQRFKSDLDGGYTRLNSRAIQEGWQFVVHGLVLKFILAALVSTYWLAHADAKSKALADMASNMYAYSFYLYFDFAGYSALAVGLAIMFGIAAPENFNHPFLAANPQDFWRRWHITLGNWLRDYIFRPYYQFVSRIRWLAEYPLLRQNSGLFLTFFVMGLWNGFHRVYIVSGSLFGLYSVVHNTYLRLCRKYERDIVFGNMPPLATKWISILIMFNLSAFALYIFSGRCPFLSSN